jgi:hypothetical protein
MAVAAISAPGSRTPVVRRIRPRTRGDCVIDGDLAKGPQEDVDRLPDPGDEFGTGDDGVVNSVVRRAEL